MCGIFFVKKPNPNILINLNFNLNNFDKIKQEFDKASYRGPEPKAAVFLDLNYFYLGFHRLSINGLNEASNQPFYKEGVFVVCNGEIYNHKELYDLLKESNIKRNTNSDCEIILDLYLNFPIDYFVKILDGVFAFIIYDTKNNVIVAARDPFGVRPLFCANNYELFSSELKQIHNLTYNNISQFPPGHYVTINITNNKNSYIESITDSIYYSSVKLCKYHTLCQIHSIFTIKNIMQNEEYNHYNNLVNTTLINAVKKRLMTDRPIACLLSGGLDSSLITSIVCKLLKDKTNVPLETYSIGMEGSTDLIAAKQVANYLGTNHTEILLSEDDFFAAIPEVIYRIESYDTTTVRASVGNYLVAKYISEHSEAKVIFNGDGSDELTGGYLYFHKAPNKLCFDNEVRNLIENINYFDVLRSDRSISSNGLEPRTPFLDKSFVHLYLSIPLLYRYQPGYIEKKLLRDSFKDYLPHNILYRQKEAFSDGVSSTERSWYQVIAEKIDKIIDTDFDNFMKTFQRKDILNKFTCNNKYPKTKEQLYYRYLFEKNYHKRDNIIPYFWMPKWSNTDDPSARKLL